MNTNNIIKILDAYNEYKETIKNVNTTLPKRKIRNPNFPSEISENIVRLALNKNLNVECNWNVKSGDLELYSMKIEVKSFSSNGPTSFGPTENWDYICFVDCTEHMKCNFKVYIVEISNKNELWKNLTVNKKQTFENQCKQSRRPRLTFKDIKEQLELKSVQLWEIFDGNINDLI